MRHVKQLKLTSLWIVPEHMEQLNKIAESEGTTPSVLIRRWIAKRTAAERRSAK